MPVTFRVNGKSATLDVSNETPFLRMLRDVLPLSKHDLRWT